MDAVQPNHSGRFKIDGYGQKLADGRFVATYVITERQADADVDLKRSTGEIFDTQEEAKEAAERIAMAWLEEHRPVNG
jgi:hypothetical protein